MIFITYCMAGVFALDQKKKILHYSLFPRDPDKILERMERLGEGVVTEELEEVLKKSGDRDVVSDINFSKEGYNVDFREKISASVYLRDNLREIAVEKGFAKNPAELNKFISEVQIARTRKRLKTGEKKDRIAMQAVSCVEDLVDISNRLSERLHEWYGHYYPELEQNVKDNRRYAETISENPQRDGIKGYSGTVGMNLDKKDLLIIKDLSKKTEEMFQLNEKIEAYLEKLMPEVAPNITAVAGPNLAAKLLVLAGGLQNLAKLPSSTIQLLGAERALFRFMKNKKKVDPPKYGILFLHPEVTNAPAEIKGKVARAVASELSMAAKTDFYTKENKSEKYKENLEKRLKEILKK
ncbi:MAG: hypothetical protein JSV92_02195 [archaeon]|nr:MAG: hypothetical protein JSV92_02195 [archaeon]